MFNPMSKYHVDIGSRLVNTHARTDRQTDRQTDMKPYRAYINCGQI